MTPDLEQIKQRADKATPGPWHDVWFGSLNCGVIWRGEEANKRTVLAGTQIEIRADAEFVAHARTDIPALLAHIDELTAENERLALAYIEATNPGINMDEVRASRQTKPPGLTAQLAVHCDKYGLPHDLDVLIQHIEANRAMTHAAQNISLDALQAKVDELTAQREKVLALHRKVDRSSPEGVCDICTVRWPCETVRALGVEQ
jgi:hypothetical protein